MADGELMDTPLQRLLVQHPDALLGAVGEDGLFVPLPPSLQVGGHQVARARSALDLVEPEDRASVVEAWGRAVADGGALVHVRIAHGEGARAVLHLTDVREVHGVFACVLVPLDGTAAQLEQAAQIVGPQSRLVRTRKDALATILEVDDDVRAVLGFDPEVLVGQRSLGYIHPDDHATAIDAWMEVLSKPGGTTRARVRHRHVDGRYIWLEISNRNLLDDPAAGWIEADMLDISEEMEALEAVRASEQLFRQLAGALPVGVAQIDASRALVYANHQLYRIFGADHDVPVADLLASVSQPDVLDEAFGTVLAGIDVDVEIHVDRMDGTGRRRCTLAIRALTSPAGDVTGAVGSLTDITDAFRMSAELERRASYDELTGCVNRSTAMKTLARELTTSGRDTAVVFIDLDRFKEVNDGLGHHAGDALLVAVANRLRIAVRACDVVGRIGGDEFLVVCPDVAGPAEGLALADRLADVIAVPLELGGGVVVPSASVGVAWAPGAVDADSLIARADAAMYESKRSGGGRAVLADDDVDHRRCGEQPVLEAVSQGAAGPAGPAAATAAAIARR